MQNKVRILALGDVVGKGARQSLLNLIPILKEKYQYDFLIVNVENTTHATGLSYKHYLQFEQAGVDAMTMGNHTFGNKEIYDYIEKADKLMVPANLINLDKKFDNHREVNLKFNGYTIKVVNILGDYGINGLDRISYMPFFDSFYKEDDKTILVIDFHADITAEKNVFAYYVDGKASLIYGTHTHVQTADERILPNGTAFITDAGMCGSVDSVIGYDYNTYIERMKNGTRTTVALNGPFMVNGILADIDLDTKKAINVTRVHEVTNH